MPAGVCAGIGGQVRPHLVSFVAHRTLFGGQQVHEQRQRFSEFGSRGSYQTVQVELMRDLGDPLARGVGLTVLRCWTAGRPR